MSGSNLSASVIEELLSLPGNNCCCDCASLDTDWACVSYGTVICLDCAGKHRALGVNISFVRSLHMDSWTPKQVETMKHGGNGRFKLYLSMANLDNSYSSQVYLQHYQSDLGLEYKSNLKQHVENVLNNHISPTDSLFTSTIMQVGDDFHSDAGSSLVVNRDDYWLEDPGCYRKISVDFPVGSMGMTLSVNTHNSYTYISKMVENGYAQGSGLYIGDVVIKVGSEYITDYHEIKNLIPCVSRPLPMIFARKFANTTPTPDIGIGIDEEASAMSNSEIGIGSQPNSSTDFQTPSKTINRPSFSNSSIPVLPMGVGSSLDPSGGVGSTPNSVSSGHRKKSPRFVKQCAGPLFPSIASGNRQNEANSTVTTYSTAEKRSKEDERVATVIDGDMEDTSLSDKPAVKFITNSRVPFSSTVPGEEQYEEEEEEETIADGEDGNDGHNISMALEVINLSSLHESPSWPGTPLERENTGQDSESLNTETKLELNNEGEDTDDHSDVMAQCEFNQSEGDVLEEVSLEDVNLNEIVVEKCDTRSEMVPLPQETSSTPISTSTTSNGNSNSNSNSAISDTDHISHTKTNETSLSHVPVLPISPSLLRIQQPTVNSWEYEVVFLSPPYGFTISRASTETSSSQSFSSLLSSTYPAAAVITKLTDRGKAAQQGVELDDTVVAVNNIWTPTYEKVLAVLAQIKLQQSQQSQQVSRNGVTGTATSQQQSLVVFRLKRSLSYIIGTTTAMIASESSKAFQDTVSFFHSFNSPSVPVAVPLTSEQQVPIPVPQNLSSSGSGDGDVGEMNGDQECRPDIDPDTTIEIPTTSSSCSASDSHLEVHSSTNTEMKYEHNTLMDEINRKIARISTHSSSSPYKSKSSLEDGSASIIFQSP